MLTHPNIVTFEDCFEDDENVYMMLELCENGVSCIVLVLVAGVEADSVVTDGPSSEAEKIYRTRSSRHPRPTHRRLSVHAPDQRHSPGLEARKSVLGRSDECEGWRFRIGGVDREAG